MPRKPGDIDDHTSRATGPRGEIYIEYTQVGQIIKVTAIDATTGIEAVIMGPASTEQSQLKKIVVQKLRMILKKSKGDSAPEDADNDSPSSKGWKA